jgi:hypothetical protein
VFAESSTCFPKRGLCKGFRVQQMKKQAPTGVSGWWSRISDFGTDERFGRLRSCILQTLDGQSLFFCLNFEDSLFAPPIVLAASVFTDSVSPIPRPGECAHLIQKINRTIQEKNGARHLRARVHASSCRLGVRELRGSESLGQDSDNIVLGG